MSFGQYIIGFIFLVIAYFIGIFGFCQIVGSIACAVKGLRSSKITAFTIILWVLILAVLTIVTLLFFNKIYKICYFVGLTFSLFIALLKTPNLVSEQSNKNKVFCTQYMRFGISCFASIQIPNEWHFEKINSANYLVVNKQGDIMMLQFTSYQAIIDSGNTIDWYRKESILDFAKLGFNDFTIFEAQNCNGKLFTRNEDNTIEKVLLIESNNGFFTAVSNFSNSLSEEGIENIYKTLSIDDPEVEKIFME